MSKSAARDGQPRPNEQRPHAAHRPPLAGGGRRWEVWWLPGRSLGRDSAITAIVLADVTGRGVVAAGDRLQRPVKPGEALAYSVDEAAHLTRLRAIERAYQTALDPETTPAPEITQILHATERTPDHELELE